MKTFGLLSSYVFVAVAAVLGIRLLALWRRTRKLPELLFALGFLIGGVGSAGLFILNTHHRRLLPIAIVPISLFAASFFNAASAATKVVAVWRIFRPAARWAAMLAAALGILIVVNLVLRAAAITTAWEWAGQVGGFGWMSIESFRYHHVLKKRLRLGLADPVVTNRLWLWGWSAGSITLMWALFGLIRLFPVLGSPVFMTLHTGVLGLLSSTLNALAFYPPRVYTRALERRRAA